MGPLDDIYEIGIPDSSELFLMSLAEKASSGLDEKAEDDPAGQVAGLEFDEEGDDDALLEELFDD